MNVYQLSATEEPARQGPQSVRRWVSHETMLIDLLGVCEFGLVVLTALTSHYVYVRVAIQDVSSDIKGFIAAGAIGGVITLFSLRSHKLYLRKAILESSLSIGRVFGAVSLSFLLLLAIAYLLKVSADFSRGWLLVWYACSVIGIISIRIAASRVFTWLAATGRTARRIAVVADAGQKEIASLASALRPELGIEMVGIFPAVDVPQCPNASNPGRLLSMLRSQLIDEVIVVSGNREPARLGNLLGQLSAFPVDVWFHPHELVTPVIRSETIGSGNILLVQPKPIRRWGYVSKVAFDYVGASILLVIMAPVMGLIALAIRLDSSGPALFRQKRHGLNYRVIDVFKFRSMYVMDDAMTVEQARPNDPRVTRLGRVLRMTSLDELPQLFNVLLGEMSLVGPRPHAVSHNEFYGDQVQCYVNRHRVKPGITGLAQVSGFRGPTDDPEKMRQRVNKDLEYISNWSMWLDIKILALTLVRGIMHRNAL